MSNGTLYTYVYIYMYTLWNSAKYFWQIMTQWNLFLRSYTTQLLNQQFVEETNKKFKFGIIGPL